MSDPADNVVAWPAPIAGLVALADLPEQPKRVPWYSGFPDFRGKLELAPRTLSVATGHPGHGKTSFLAQLWFDTIRASELAIVVATFETLPNPDYRRLLRQFWAHVHEDAMDASARREADDFIHDHYRFLVHPQQRPTLDWIFEWTEKANAFDVLVIDPFNRLESQRRKDETETEYIAWVLTEAVQFAQRHNAHVQIIAHPAKTAPQYRGRVPALEDISGSKHWDNMPDQGFAVHREHFYDKDTGRRRYDAKLFHLKTRYEELGHPCAFDVKLNPHTWRFEVVK